MLDDRTMEKSQEYFDEMSLLINMMIHVHPALPISALSKHLSEYLKTIEEVDNDGAARLIEQSIDGMNNNFEKVGLKLVRV